MSWLNAKVHDISRKGACLTAYISCTQPGALWFQSFKDFYITRIITIYSIYETAVLKVASLLDHGLFFIIQGVGDFDKYTPVPYHGI